MNFVQQITILCYIKNNFSIWRPQKHVFENNLKTIAQMKNFTLNNCVGNEISDTLIHNSYNYYKK